VSFAAKCYTWFYGIGGYGKTQAMRRLYAGRAALPTGCALFIDPNGKNADLGRVFTRARDLGKAAKRRPFALVYQGEYGDDADELWPLVMRLGGLLLCVDEAAEWAAADSTSRPFLELVRKGRNNWVDIATTSQAPTDMNPKFRQQADVVMSFRQAEPDYAKLLEKKFIRGPNAAEQLLKLPRLHYLRASLQGGFQDVSGGVVPCPTCGPLGWLQPHRRNCPIFDIEAPPVGGARI
jgi:hypothetical protein